KGCAPWEYPTESLHCLCEVCHQKVQEKMTLIHRQMGKIGVGASLDRLLGYTIGLEQLGFPMVIATIRGQPEEFAEGVANAWGLDAGQIIPVALAGDGTLNGYQLHDICEQLGVRHR